MIWRKFTNMVSQGLANLRFCKLLQIGFHKDLQVLKSRLFARICYGHFADVLLEHFRVMNHFDSEGLKNPTMRIVMLRFHLCIARATDHDDFEFA